MREIPENELMAQPEKTDDQIMDEIKTLIENEGWHFQGSFFQGGEKQEYELVLSKEGFDNKTYLTKKPYRDIVDASGKTIE